LVKSLSESLDEQTFIQCALLRAALDEGSESGPLQARVDNATSFERLIGWGANESAVGL